jgi:hypothetical protein
MTQGDMPQWHSPDELSVEEVLADRVLAAGSRCRRRRSAWMVGGVLTVEIAVAAPVLAARDGHPALAADTRGSTAAGHTSRSALPAGSSSPISGRAAIYAAALIHRSTGSVHADVYVRDQVCATVISKPGSQCADSAVPTRVRRELAQLLPFPVHFVAQRWGPRTGWVKSLIVFGSLTITQPDRATLGIETLCGPLCGDGKTLVLARTGDGWRVTGQTGPDWIS